MMVAIAPVRPRPQPAPRPVAVTRVAAPPLQRALSLLLGILSAGIAVIVVVLVVVSPVQHYATQNVLYDQLRLSLAEGSTPVEPVTADGDPLAVGTPLAVMYAHGVGIDREVIVEGSAGAQTMLGIGHQRNTVMPCQLGTSVLMARSSSSGGVGSAWARLRVGQTFTVQAGQGACTYKVRDRRLAGDEAPPALTAGEGRVVLTTATGGWYTPTGVLRVDADLVTKGYDRPAQLGMPVSPAERPMGTDPTNAFGLVLLLELLVAAVLGATWLWRRWGRWQTWIVSGPVIGVIALFAATSLTQIVLPNLL